MMNVETNRPLAVYPSFHDTQSKKQVNSIDNIDNSIYHLLSLYLNTDTLVMNNSSNSNNKRVHHNLLSLQQRQNWFGENNYHQNKQDDLLKQNTYKNTNISITIKATKPTNTKRRTKSVSFNETVTVISSQDNTISQTLLKQQQQTNATPIDEDVFVDALESFDQ